MRWKNRRAGLFRITAITNNHYLQQCINCVNFLYIVTAVLLKVSFRLRQYFFKIYSWLPWKLSNLLQIHVWFSIEQYSSSSSIYVPLLFTSPEDALCPPWVFHWFLPHLVESTSKGLQDSVELRELVQYLLHSFPPNRPAFIWKLFHQ